ncbi:hypothetical protein G127AT_05030 [Agromyces archimandritae]|uniref:SGNH hydrolase-type esterase domain-containing protein n=1 Tax=Agromyces archimandritae TaxID=2781962 RepID=A0A975FQ07_9MICO|nr:hypothetical protein [Agromyces archimandritae]QTX05578.1 hypothetical protein G127AT_05030 [Agromyces archimandritae]
MAGIPPFERFEAFPRTLRRYLAGRAAAVDAVSRRICDRPGVTWVDSTVELDMGPDFFARDGFHPSALGYRSWASLVADAVPA